MKSLTKVWLWLQYSSAMHCVLYGTTNSPLQLLRPDGSCTSCCQVHQCSVRLVCNQLLRYARLDHIFDYWSLLFVLYSSCVVLCVFSLPGVLIILILFDFVLYDFLRRYVTLLYVLLVSFIIFIVVYVVYSYIVLLYLPRQSIHGSLLWDVCCFTFVPSCVLIVVCMCCVMNDSPSRVLYVSSSSQSAVVVSCFSKRVNFHFPSWHTKQETEKWERKNIWESME